MTKFKEHTAQHDEYNYSREDPFYIVALSKDAIEGLDDYIKNIHEWEAMGGIGVHHTSPSNTLAELKRLGFK